MASFALPASFTSKRVPNSPFFSTSGSHPRSKQTSNRFKVLCKDVENEKIISPTPKPQNQLILPQNIDRRNLLLGLGGIYSTVNLASLPAALADPIRAPDISTCRDANEGFFDPNNIVRGKACCPPDLKKTIQDFVFPGPEEVVRIRPAAHRASDEYVAKYRAAIQAIRDLPPDHPHSYVQQAKLHCAYCNGGYTQVASGYPDKELQIHNSWLFYPFHRWYLYFYERILRKYSGDPTFALPYWNWDHPSGMTMPEFFEGEFLPKKNPDDPNVPNPAFDAYRDASHVPPAVLNMNVNDQLPQSVNQISDNLKLMHQQMTDNATDWCGFFGGEFHAGDDAKTLHDPYVGSIEAGVHTAVHIWVGDSRMPNNEDMGNLYSSGYDPLFYVHHANVDRMWKIWKDMAKDDHVKYKGHTEPTDEDWLNASYVFYDENENLVRVYNKDCVDMEKLKYDYEPSPTPWMNSAPIPRNKKSNVAARSAGTVKKVENVQFPVKVDRIVKVLVKRPAKSRSKADKEKANELLVLKGIEFDGQKYVKFDVFVNEDDISASSACDSEFVGSFTQLPHTPAGGHMLMKSGIRFGLTQLLEDIGAEDDEYILVTLVPKPSYPNRATMSEDSNLGSDFITTTRKFVKKWP